MRKRIYLSLCGISIFAVLITSGLVVWRFYSFYTLQAQQQVRDQCLTLAQQIENRLSARLGDAENTPRAFLREQYMSQETRITLIQPDGTTVFDSSFDSKNLQNHADRPEVQEAIDRGEGSAARYSDTTRGDTYYYAKLLSDGEVIRLSIQTRSIRGLFYSAIPIMAGVIVLLFFSCVWISFLLTKRLIAPLEEMSRDLDDTGNWKYYDELSPFVKKIAAQQKEISERIEEQKRLENIRKEFTSNVSHELKTPLTSISGYAEMIETGMAAQGDVRFFAQKIVSEAKRLVSLINDIIRLSRIEKTQEEGDAREKEIVNIFEICKNVLESLHFAANAAKVDLRVFGSPNTAIYANPVMMEEMIFNLCDNGIQYNREGGHVYILLTKEGDMFNICVKDSGIGVPAGHHQRIFERFYRVDKSRSKQSGGTGLGLSIVKHIVEFHNGTITLESKQGEGTEVTVRLPV